MERACNDPHADNDPIHSVLREMFAETAIMLTHSDPSRQALAKERVYKLLYDLRGPSGGQDRIVAEELIAALTTLAERGIPADIQEMLVSGNPDRGIAPGALAYALKAALRAPIERKGEG